MIYISWFQSGRGLRVVGVGERVALPVEVRRPRDRGEVAVAVAGKIGDDGGRAR